MKISGKTVICVNKDEVIENITHMIENEYMNENFCTEVFVDNLTKLLHKNKSNPRKVHSLYLDYFHVAVPEYCVKWFNNVLFKTVIPNLHELLIPGGKIYLPLVPHFFSKIIEFEDDLNKNYRCYLLNSTLNKENLLWAATQEVGDKKTDFIFGRLRAGEKLNKENVWKTLSTSDIHKVRFVAKRIKEEQFKNSDFIVLEKFAEGPTAIGRTASLF